MASEPEAVRCDRCGARRFVGLLDGLVHALCPRAVPGTWRKIEKKCREETPGSASR